MFVNTHFKQHYRSQSVYLPFLFLHFLCFLIFCTVLCRPFMCFVLFVPPQMFCSLFQDDVRPKDPLPVLPCIMYLLHIYISFGAINDVLLWKLKLASIDLPVPVCVFLLRLLTCSRLFIILNPTPNPLAMFGAVHLYHNLWVKLEKNILKFVFWTQSHSHIKMHCFPFCDRSKIKQLLCLSSALPTSDYPKGV